MVKVDNNVKYRDDSEKTGWISPDGEFWGCGPQDHYKLATIDLGRNDETDLEAEGWIKIYTYPIEMRLAGISTPKNVYDYFGKPTEAQKNTLTMKGITLHEFDW